MNELVNISPAEYGIEDNKANEIKAVFTPMLDRMAELEDEFNEVVNLPVSQESIKKAKALRLLYVKIRTGTSKIHTEQKAFYRAGGLFVDGIKNTILFANQGKEEKLKEIETHYQRIEQERLDKLQADRELALEPYGHNNTVDLAKMTEDVWKIYFAGVKLDYEQRIEAERKAEKAKIAKEKADALERKRIRQENERLKKEAEERERVAKIEREKQIKKQAEERAKHEAVLKAEREKQEQIAAQLKAKEIAEKKRIAKEKAERDALKKAEKAALLAPDKIKLESLCMTLSDIQLPEVANDESKEIINNVDIMLNKIIAYIKTKSDKSAE